MPAGLGEGSGCLPHCRAGGDDVIDDHRRTAAPVRTSPCGHCTGQVCTSLDRAEASRVPYRPLQGEQRTYRQVERAAGFSGQPQHMIPTPLSSYGLSTRHRNKDNSGRRRARERTDQRHLEQLGERLSQIAFASFLIPDQSGAQRSGVPAVSHNGQRHIHRQWTGAGVDTCGTQRASARAAPHTHRGDDQVEKSTYPRSCSNHAIDARVGAPFAAALTAALWITSELSTELLQIDRAASSHRSVKDTERSAPVIGPLNEYTSTGGHPRQFSGGGGDRLRSRRKITRRTLAKRRTVRFHRPDPVISRIGSSSHVERRPVVPRNISNRHVRGGDRNQIVDARIRAIALDRAHGALRDAARSAEHKRDTSPVGTEPNGTDWASQIAPAGDRNLTRRAGRGNPHQVRAVPEPDL